MKNTKGKLREALMRRTYTLKDMCDELSVKQNTAHNWNVGLSKPKIDQFWKLAKFLNTNMCDLYIELYEDVT